MLNKLTILSVVFIFVAGLSFAQNNTYSPYSRYGFGELNQSTFAHNTGMGGACIAFRPDSMIPTFINVGNPASYALIRFTSLEVGGKFHYSKFTGNSSALRQWNTNFDYAALGFPIKAKGGMCFGIMPYSSTGYDLKSIVDAPSIGEVGYLYSGSGGLSKAFAGYGVMPFNRSLINFRRKYLYIPDTAHHLKRSNYVIRETVSKLLSDLSLGFNINYVFGSINQTSKVIYPSSILYNNTFRERKVTFGDFTGNFGIQTAYTIDSTGNKKGRNKRIENEIAGLTTQNIYSEAELKQVRDSLERTMGYKRKRMNEKVKITFGAFMSLNNSIKANYDVIGFNYILNGFGDEILRDTVIYNVNQTNTIKLPLEQGFGIGLKKGERINIAADFAITNWQTFKFLNVTDVYKNNYRIAAGINYVPDKFAAGSGAFWKRLQYRFGAQYNTGYIQLANNSLVSNYAITAGLGIPVGIIRNSSMVNVSAQYGFNGPFNNSGVKENYWRINFGFTLNDKWFQKQRED